MLTWHCLFDLAYLSHGMHTEKCYKHLFVSYLFNAQTPARSVINIKISITVLKFHSVANQQQNAKGFLKAPARVLLRLRRSESSRSFEVA